MAVTLKLATSLDGRIATSTGESRWITGPAAREAVHRLRAAHDAVVVGIGTALADDPELTVRLSAYEGRQPARVVLDSRQRLPVDGKLARTAREVPTFVVSASAPAPPLVACGVKIIAADVSADGRVDLKSGVQALATHGLFDLFVEGGGEVAAGFLRAGLVDRLEWFRAPIVLGAEGRPGVGAMAVAALAEAPHLRRVEVREIGPDLWERYERA